MQGMVDAVKKEPPLAKATLYSKVNWRGGFFTEASVKDFTAGGVMNKTSRSKPFVVPQDHPPELGGNNKGATAGELLLSTLGHCVTGGFASSAAVLGIPIESLRVEAEGDVDLQGMLGLPEPGAIRPGFQEFRLRYFVRSIASREQLENVAKMAEDLSPVKDSLRAVKFSSRLIIQ